jgi:membrane protein YqaA with SNARE-associated domain
VSYYLGFGVRKAPYRDPIWVSKRAYPVVYLWGFLIGVGFDLVPIVGPPVWMGLVFLVTKFDANPWLVLSVGVPGSVLGRYLLSLYTPWLSGKVIKRKKNDDMRFVGQRLDQKLWQSWIFVLIYSLSPLPTTPLFSASGLAKIPAMQIIPPFFVGKFVSDAVMLFTGSRAIAHLADLLHGTMSVKGIATIVISILIILGFLFLDWRAVLEKKKVRFSPRIWK